MEAVKRLKGFDCLRGIEEARPLEIVFGSKELSIPCRSALLWPPPWSGSLPSMNFPLDAKTDAQDSNNTLAWLQLFCCSHFPHWHLLDSRFPLRITFVLENQLISEMWDCGADHVQQTNIDYLRWALFRRTKSEQSREEERKALRILFKTAQGLKCKHSL